MEAWITHLALHGPYIVIVGLLLLSGFGLPLPEDIPLIVAGYLCAMKYANAWFMLPALFIAIIGADSIVYFLGHHYGHHVPRLPLIKRFLTPARLGKAERLLQCHGGKFIFVARFLPGLRAPAIFTAGTFKLTYWRFIFYDGSAALISVPTIFLLAFYFACHLDKVRKWIFDGQFVTGAVLIIIIISVIAFKLLYRQRVVSVGNSP